MNNQTINQEKLNELFEYKDGWLVRKIAVGTRGPKGQIPGHFNKRGVHITKIFGKSYKTHRLIWMMHNGEIPEGHIIYHIDSDTADNCIENLDIQDCSVREGVEWIYRLQRYKVTILEDNILRVIGWFKDPDKGEAPAWELYENTRDQINAAKALNQPVIIKTLPTI